MGEIQTGFKVPKRLSYAGLTGELQTVSAKVARKTVALVVFNCYGSNTRFEIETILILESH